MYVLGFVSVGAELVPVCVESRKRGLEVVYREKYSDVSS